jgi:hypothetical protein
MPPPEELRDSVEGDPALSQAREFAPEARTQHLGIFEEDSVLLLMPFELRYLSRRRTPSRYVLDLSKAEAKLLKPSDYHKVENLEDRLFIPSHFVPLLNEQAYEIRG